MRQYFGEDWAQPAPAASPSRRAWYLPHHAVYQDLGDEWVPGRIRWSRTVRLDLIEQTTGGGTESPDRSTEAALLDSSGRSRVRRVIRDCL
ncbi:hypothetical protein T4B_1291 [Trichinella pseudospiralis]|uniref:DUF5641 domain-containing protein n=1 Tax=Trichinella pseudospiralis TaxID=6337 RepID=A0A0V1JBN4_TRIPS|nr:hypothetical protein T4B_1291 [Trichinella pseudospiralis]